MIRTREIRLDTRQGLVAGLRWRQTGAPRVLCLHGWLDNAASFIPLAPLLDGLDRVAIDLPGHGFSEHRHETTRYHFIDYLFNVDAVLDRLGWDDCHLLGHSLGAAISAVYAAGAPERVRSLVLLDSIGPISAQPETTTDRLRRSLVKHRRGGSEPRRFDSIDEMVRARRNVSDLSEQAARLVCYRAARQVGRQFVWRSDPALNWISSLVMTDEQALDLLRHIEAPTLTFTVTPESPWFSREKIEARRRAIAHGRHVTLEGHHHFHMDEPEKIADTVREFIVGNDRPAEKPTE
ncbi:MAG: alpha/beta hydrolase [Gammaproteobacteria bacterium]|nr:alpha/beta hydrolase [Gammaproteobacteria bacterium]NNK32128.1 alpha/beta hydrolase [Xanthomonadales bacterium]